MRPMIADWTRGSPNRTRFFPLAGDVAFGRSPRIHLPIRRDLVRRVDRGESVHECVVDRALQSVAFMKPFQCSGAPLAILFNEAAATSGLLAVDRRIAFSIQRQRSDVACLELVACAVYFRTFVVLFQAVDGQPKAAVVARRVSDEVNFIGRTAALRDGRIDEFVRLLQSCRDATCGRSAGRPGTALSDSAIPATAFWISWLAFN